MNSIYIHHDGDIFENPEEMEDLLENFKWSKFIPEEVEWLIHIEKLGRKTSFYL